MLNVRHTVLNTSLAPHSVCEVSFQHRPELHVYILNYGISCQVVVSSKDEQHGHEDYNAPVSQDWVGHGVDQIK